MMKKSFYGLVVCLSMFAVVMCSGVASAAGIGEPCTGAAECDDTLFCNGIESCTGEASATVCAAGTAQCAGEVCDEVTDTCVECLIDDDCTEDKICEGNLCVVEENQCPELDGIDLDGNCLLSKDELKIYSDFIKNRQKVEKDALKTKHTDEKNYIKLLKSEYAE